MTIEQREKLKEILIGYRVDEEADKGIDDYHLNKAMNEIKKLFDL